MSCREGCGARERERVLLRRRRRLCPRRGCVVCVSLGEGRLGVWCLLAWRDDGELAECEHGEGKECVESEEESEAGLSEVFGAAGLYGVP